MSLDTQPKFTTRRTYVVKIRNDAKPDALAGRFENFVTRRQRAFASGHELLELIAIDLQTSDDEPPADSTSD